MNKNLFTPNNHIPIKKIKIAVIVCQIKVMSSNKH